MMPQRPLYKLEKGTDLPQQCRKHNGHAGLCFDKFCDTWSSNCTMEGNSKLAWINKFTQQAVGMREGLEEAAKRLMWLVKKRGGRAEIFKSEYCFVTGLGRSHPVENGFTWHPTLGTPYLPGSSIKGLVRSWVEKEVGPDKKTLNRLLGSESLKKAGSICFLDAIPTKPVLLKADVMTPHYAGWSVEDPPGDWCSPTPIPFLVMKEQTFLLFGIIPRSRLEDDDLDRVIGWLRDALAQCGGGAKTAVGYGRFGPDEKATSEWHSRLDEEQRQAEAQKSPEGRWRLKLEGKSENDILEYVRVHLEKERLNDNIERHAFVKVMLLDHEEWVDLWRSGKKCNPQTRLGKKKLKERAKLLDDERPQ